MRAVYLYTRTSSIFRRHCSDFTALSSTDFVAFALAAGDRSQVRDLLRKQGIELKVKIVLKSTDVALRDVDGSDAEREIFRYKLFALRIWGGCSFVFFYAQST